MPKYAVERFRGQADDPTHALIWDDAVWAASPMDAFEQFTEFADWLIKTHNAKGLTAERVVAGIVDSVFVTETVIEPNASRDEGDESSGDNIRVP